MSNFTLKKLAADQAVEGVKKTDLFRVDPRLLQEEDGFNLRDYGAEDTIASIRAFADSYKAGQYVPPLVVYLDGDGNIIIVEGHKRRRGALIAIEEGADIAYVDCVQFRGGADERVALMLRSANGQPLTPLQMAFGMLRLHRWGHSNAVIGEKSGGKTASNVEQLLLLAQAEPDVHALVRSEAVAAHTAIDAIRKYGVKAGEFLNKQLDAAKAKGKNKVTKADVHGWAPPRKLSTALVTCVDSLTSTLDRETRHRLAEFEKMDAEQVRGQKITVDAAALLELVRTHGQVTEARSKAETSAAGQAAAQGQSHLKLAA